MNKQKTFLRLVALGFGIFLMVVGLRFLYDRHQAVVLFEENIFCPVPKSVKIIDSQIIGFLDAERRITFQTDQATFEQIIQDYQPIKRCESINPDAFSKDGFLFYKKTVVKVFNGSYPRKYKNVHYLVWDIKNKTAYYNRPYASSYGVDEEIPEENGITMTDAFGFYEKETCLDEGYPFYVERYDAFDQRIGSWYRDWGFKRYDVREYDAEGQPKQGTYRDYYENKSIHSESFYQDGSPVGIHKIFYPNGQIKLEINYNDSLSEGHKKFFYPVDLPQIQNGVERIYNEDGRLKYEYQYQNDKKHGIQRDYYPNGNLKMELEYNNGHFEGLNRYFYPNGQLRSESRFIDNQRIERKNFDPQGNSIASPSNTFKI